MSDLSYTTVQVSGVTRLKSSVNGNPRYLFHFKNNGVWPKRTAPDIGDAYKVVDSWADKWVRIGHKMYYGHDQIFSIDVVEWN